MSLLLLPQADVTTINPLDPHPMSMDPNRYEVSEPELLRGLRLFRRGSFLQDGP